MRHSIDIGDIDRSSDQIVQRSDVIRHRAAMKKVLIYILVILGAIALYFGFNATNAPMEEVAEAFT